MELRERLSATDPSNAVWQRDLYLIYSKMATVTEQSGEGDAREWWRKAYETLSAMKKRGVLLPTDEPFLEQSREKMGGPP